MKTAFKLSVAAAALACANASMADTAQVVFDVSNITKRIETGDPATTGIDVSFQPAGFQMVLSFDLSQRALPVSVSPYFTEGHGLTFRSTLSESPFTATLNPPGASKGTTSLEYANASYAVSGLGDARSADLFLDASFEEAGPLTHAQGQTIERDYARRINLTPPSPLMDLNTVKSWTLNDVASMYAGRIGQTIDNGFSEYVSERQGMINLPGIYLRGDVTIRSVNVVPEPGTWALMGLGLAAVAMARRQRRAA